MICLSQNTNTSRSGESAWEFKLDYFDCRISLHHLFVGELMPVQYQTISLPFSAGLDTKTDSKMLAPPKLLRFCRMRFLPISSESLSCHGYINMTTTVMTGGNWSSPKMVKSYRNELLLAATTSKGQRLLSYSQALNAWQDKGKYLSVKVSKEVISSPQSLLLFFFLRVGWVYLIQAWRFLEISHFMLMIIIMAVLLGLHPLLLLI